MPSLQRAAPPHPRALAALLVACAGPGGRLAANEPFAQEVGVDDQGQARSWPPSWAH